MKNEKEYFIAETRKNEYFHNQDQNVVKYRKKDNKKFFLGSGLEELETAVLEGGDYKAFTGFRIYLSIYSKKPEFTFDIWGEIKE